jgi:integrase
MFKRVAGVNPHIARHTIATSMEAAGESANTIAAHLGDSVATVQKNYIHTRAEHQKAAVARLDERFYGRAKNR